MKVIREDIIADVIQFTVPADVYRGNSHGFTRLDAVHKIAAMLGIEIEDIDTMQGIPIGESKVTIVCRG